MATTNALDGMKALPVKNGSRTLPKRDTVYFGMCSWFGNFSGKSEWNDDSDSGNTASGMSNDDPGIAFYNKATLGHYFLITMPNNKTYLVQQIDIGPNPTSGKFVDINSAFGEAAGYSPKNFPTGQYVLLQYVGKDKPEPAKITDGFVPTVTKAPVISSPTVIKTPAKNFPTGNQEFPPKNYRTINPMVSDLSHHNSPTDFEAARNAGIVGIIHKASQGSGNTDAKYQERRGMALDAGLLWGAYHFGGSGDVEAQVDHFLECAGDDKKTLLCLDYEPYAPSQMGLDEAREFLESIFKRTGQYPVLYSGNLIKQDLGTDEDEFFAKHRLWLSQYNSITNIKVPATWKKYWLLQYSGDGKGPEPHDIDGIGENIDISSYPGTKEQLAAEWVMNSEYTDK